MRVRKDAARIQWKSRSARAWRATLGSLGASANCASSVLGSSIDGLLRDVLRHLRLAPLEDRVGRGMDDHEGHASGETPPEQRPVRAEQDCLPVSISAEAEEIVNHQLHLPL